jgi:hypothetical protein
LYANPLNDKSLLINGYSLIKLYITNVLTEWMFFEMDYHVDRKVTEMVTVSEEMPIVVSKTKWN